MTNDVRIVVTADNSTAKGFTAALATVRSFVDEVKNAGAEGSRSLATLNESVRDTRGSFQELGTAARGAGRDMRTSAREGRSGMGNVRDEVQDTTRSTLTLAEAIKKAKREYEELTLAAAAAGGGDSGANRKSAMAKKALADLKALSKEAEEAGANVGRSFVSTVHQTVSDGVGALPPGAKAALIAAVGTIALSTAPVIGAAVSAGVLLGIGSGALAGGIMAAVSDPEVANGFKLLGNQAQAQFIAAGASFRKPLIDAASSFSTALKSMDIGGVIAPMASTIKPLSDGLIGLVRNALPGIKTGVAAAVPLFNALAGELPKIGTAIGTFTAEVGGASGGAKRLLVDMLRFTENAVIGIGAVIGGLGKMYEYGRKVSDFFGSIHPVIGWVDDLFSTSDGLTSTLTPLNSATEASGAYAMSTEDAAAAAQAARDAFDAERQASDALTGSLKSGVDANIALEQAIDDLDETRKKNGRTLDIANQAGRDNVRVLEEGIDAAMRAGAAETDRALAEGDMANATLRGNAVRDAGIQKIREHAAALGYDRAQVDALIRSLGGLPTGEKTLAYSIRVSVYGNGVGSQTAAQIANSARLLSKGMAEGGPVVGGSGYRDDVPRMLMGGEHVLTKEEVSAMGGQDAVTAWRRSLISGATSGGGVDVRPAGGGGFSGGAQRAAQFLLGSDGSRLGDLLVDLIAVAVKGQGGRPETLGLKSA